MNRNRHEGCESFDYELNDVPLECYVEYSPPSRGARERSGLQLEPDYPADATLCYAYVGGTDIFDILSAEQCREIENAFLEQEEIV